ncbi:MAG TPA: phasin family protein [Actinomycetes bacterium]|nr:phasin family protein [Actinomycetes bacterium]
MANAREQYLQAMASLTEMTRTRAERLASRLAKQGELQSGQVGRFAEDLVRRTQRNRETMSRLIQREVKRQLSVLGIATRDEVARLQQRIRALEQAVERPGTAGRATGRGTSSRSGGSRAAASRGSTSTAGAGTTRRSGSGGSGRSGGASGRSTGARSSRSSGSGSGRAAGGTRRTTRRDSSDSGQETSQDE